jgi:serine protease AprX
MTAVLSAKSGLRPRLVLALIGCLFSLALAPAGPAASDEAGRIVSVIVQGLNGAGDARAAVEVTGGEVIQDLSFISSVTADVPESALPALEAHSSVRQVSPNGAIGFHGKGDDSGVTHRIQKVVNSDDLWRNGINGQGVTVALLDTGVYAGHPDLAGRVVHCEDFSHESGTEAHCADTFGHGTFMAGLIAGDGTASNGKYKGAAPKVNIVSVKAAGYDGSTDVSTILAGIQWIVAHKDTYGIRVLNLSLGSDSSQDYRLSPLNYAVERAWNEGIAVVVSAGNSGPDSTTIMKPGDDPYVITVGASNDEGSMAIGDDMVPVFSSRGPTRSNGLAKPDVVSPGVHTTSLRSPGSAIDQQFGSTAVVDENYFKGTGTSMSTATVTGVVAQILTANPGLNPNQVKHRLLSTARDIAVTDPLKAGHGLIDAYGAARSTSTTEANQGLEGSTGLGLLQADRGSIDLEVVTPAGSLAMSGEYSAQIDPDQVSLTNPAGLVPWTGTQWKADGWDVTSWDGTQWKTEDWAGTQWKGTQWKATVWSGTQWKGTQWKNADWDGTQWKDVDWDGTQWKGTQWKSYWYAAAWD